MNMIEGASAIIWRGKAYVPVQAKILGNGHMAVEPVFVADLTAGDLVTAFERTIAAGEPVIRQITDKAMKRRKDPILASTGAANWDELAKGSLSYTITWHDNEVTLFMPSLDATERFNITVHRTQIFPPDTPLQTLIEVILADVARGSGISASPDLK